MVTDFVEHIDDAVDSLSESETSVVVVIFPNSTILREAQGAMVARGLLGHEQDFLDSLAVMEEGMRHFYVRAIAATLSYAACIDPVALVMVPWPQSSAIAATQVLRWKPGAALRPYSCQTSVLDTMPSALMIGYTPPAQLTL